ncbi:MAG: hypothetical protein LKF41_03525 [Bifidobacterium sp.]|nr:hypothetical protein [Bifidobacterium sp.]MCH4174915.1 hypothetical protein [Bifidobacterium sp.]
MKEGAVMRLLHIARQRIAETEHFGRRLGMSFVGVFLCGASVACFSKAAFGVDPFTSLAMGLWRISGFAYNTVYIVINVIMLLAVTVVARHRLGVATLFTVFVTGSVAQLGMGILDALMPVVSWQIRFVLLLIGVIVLCFSSSLYYVADLGVSGYDAIALTIAERTVIPFRYCRIGTDIFCVGVGFLCGTSIGLGTLITAFFMGPLIDFFTKVFSEPFLYGRSKGTKVIQTIETVEVIEVSTEERS